MSKNYVKEYKGHKVPEWATHCHELGQGEVSFYKVGSPRVEIDRLIGSPKFRPLKTQEQKDREAFHMAVIDACMGIHKDDFNIDEIAGALYHADFKAPEGE